MTSREFFATISRMIVANGWDIPAPDQMSDPSRRYYGPDASRREATKALGRAMQQSTKLDDQIIGYGLEAKAHYFESLEAAVCRKRKHPKFAEYIAHWFYTPTRNTLLALPAAHSKSGL